MMTHSPHIPDPDLIALIDHELSGRKGARAERHLQTCADCRARKARLESVMTEFLAATGEEIHTGDEQQALRTLRARMNTLETSRRLAVGRLKPLFTSLLPAAAALALLFAMYFAARQEHVLATPNAALTPGATRAADKDEICSLPNVEQFYPIPSAVAYRVFETYGIRNPKPQAYEVDYLITPALGGADDIRNLWPQPYAGNEWNAHVKDALEDHLYNLVCSGQVSLEKAQRDIATNWIAAYKQYFQTDQPLIAHRTFLKDPPWPHEMAEDR